MRLLRIIGWTVVVAGYVLHIGAFLMLAMFIMRFAEALIMTAQGRDYDWSVWRQPIFSQAALAMFVAWVVGSVITRIHESEMRYKREQQR